MLDLIGDLAQLRAASLAAISAIDPGEVHSFASDLAAVLREGGTIFAAGNGGSATQAQHFASELVGRFQRARQGLSALALNADSTVMSAIANDFGYEQVFARQLSAQGRHADVFVPISTSGSSENLLEACRAARVVGIRVMSMSGPDPNPLQALSQRCLIVRSPSTAAIQEAHLTMIHMICRVIDHAV